MSGSLASCRSKVRSCQRLFFPSTPSLGALEKLKYVSPDRISRGVLHSARNLLSIAEQRNYRHRIRFYPQKNDRELPCRPYEVPEPLGNFSNGFPNDSTELERSPRTVVGIEGSQKRRKGSGIFFKSAGARVPWRKCVKHACIPSFRTCKRALQVRAPRIESRYERVLRMRVPWWPHGTRRGLRGELARALVSPARGGQLPAVWRTVKNLIHLIRVLGWFSACPVNSDACIRAQVIPCERVCRGACN